jgi:hypothetical protein
MTIVNDVLDEAREEFGRRMRGDETLDEALFAHIAIGLRHLSGHRHYVGEVLDAALSPFSGDGICEQAREFRLEHIEMVGSLIGSYASSAGSVPSAMTMHLYWALYLGVLSFWAADGSPAQEDTLAVLDQSMRLFADSLSSESTKEREVTDVADNPENR